MLRPDIVFDDRSAYATLPRPDPCARSDGSEASYCDSSQDVRFVGETAIGGIGSLDFVAASASGRKSTRLR